MVRFEILGLCFTDAAGAATGHDPWLVALSYVTATFASYVALDMAERLRHAKQAWGWIWHGAASLALGGGIWAMHFLGMLAFHIQVDVGFHGGLTLLSLAVPILVVAVGLWLVRDGVGPARLLPAGVIVGMGVVVMHYTGMAALILPGTIAYEPGLFALSVLIAIAAATVALWLALTPHRVSLRVVAAFVMGGAICGMHYTGMGALVVTLDPTLPAMEEGLPALILALAIAAATYGMLVLALVAGIADRRISAASAREAEQLRRSYQVLEQEMQVRRCVEAELERTRAEIIRRLCSAGEFRDEETGQHVTRIGRMAGELATLAGLPAAMACEIAAAAPLHDIGKIGIPDRVLLKPGKLDSEEWVVMRSHARIGQQILAGSGLALLDRASEIAGTHHEKWDGSGYPEGLAGDAIPISGRIVAICDVFDALLSRRPYKDPWPEDKACQHLDAIAGSHLDPALARLFIDNIDRMRAIRAELRD